MQDNSQIDSLIPLLFTKTRSAQGALDEAAQMVKSAVDRFELAETELKALYATSPQILANVTDFVDGCKYACTGNASWRLVATHAASLIPHEKLTFCQ